MMRFYRLLFSLVLFQLVFTGCGGLDHGRGLDEASIQRARAAYRERVSLVSVQTQDDDTGDKWPTEQPSDRAGSFLDVVVAEVIAIGPGMFVQGLGHRYAGDYKTAGQLMRVGGVGIGLSGLSFGLVAGGREISEDWIGDAISGAGYGVGILGVGYYLSAWWYDIYDTPRAVRSGGRPPPNSPFVDSLDFIGGE